MATKGGALVSLASIWRRRQQEKLVAWATQPIIPKEKFPPGAVDCVDEPLTWKQMMYGMPIVRGPSRPVVFVNTAEEAKKLFGGS